MQTIKPNKLILGDTVGICCPSGTIAHKKDAFERAKNNFERATKLKTIIASNAFAKHYYSAGTPEERAADFHELLKNPDVKAIIFAAGGDTALDVLSLLDFELIKNNPKIIMGISDATTILAAITAKTGLITFLGLEFLDFATRELPYTLASVQQLLYDGNAGEIHANTHWEEFDGIHTTYSGWQTIQEGVAKGTLIGGNLQSFMQLVGTQYELSAPDAVLFFEAYKLPKKQIHKALMQLKLRGYFQHISGMIIGYNLESDNQDVVGNEQPIAETVLEVVGEYNFPIMQIGEIGHHVENFLQPIGAQVRMDATNLKFEIVEPTVE